MGPGETLRRMVDAHRRHWMGVVEARGVGRMRKLYDDARREMTARLEELRRQNKGQTFTAAHAQAVEAQLLLTVREIEDVMQAHMERTGPAATALAGRHMVDAVDRMGRMFSMTTPLIGQEDAAVFMGAIPGVDSSLMSRYRSSVRTYGAQTIPRIEQRLALSTTMGETVDEVVDRVSGEGGILAAERWRSERIVRTELAYSYGVSKQESMRRLRARAPKMRKRLVATFDSRTGDDSVDLHGQIRDVHEPFVWVVKNSKGVPTGKVVRYMQPPNRPNDREISIPWMDGWPESKLRAP